MSMPTDLHAGLKNSSPKAIDSSYGKKGGASVNDAATRSSVPKVASNGPRSA
jgi:hypothetical protein